MYDITPMPWAEFTQNEVRTRYQQDSNSLRRFKLDTGVYRYGWELATIDIPWADGRRYASELRRAMDDTIIFSHPWYRNSQGTVPAAGIFVDGGFSQGLDTIQMTSTQPWQLISGDIIQPSNDTKVYEVAEDTALGIGSKSVKLASKLRNPLVDNSEMTAENVYFFLELDGTFEVTGEASNGRFVEINASFIEKL